MSHGVLNDDQVEDLVYHFFVRFFDIFCLLISLDCRLQLSILFWRILGSVCLVHRPRYHRRHGHKSLQVLLHCLLVVVRDSYLCEDVRKMFSNMLAMPFLVATTLPDSLLISVMKKFLVLMPPINFVPLNSLRILCTFSRLAPA